MCLFLMGAGAGSGSGVEMVRGAAEAGAVLGWGTAGTGLKLAGILGRGAGAGAGVGTPDPSLCCRGAGRPEDGPVYNGDTVYNEDMEAHFRTLCCAWCHACWSHCIGRRVTQVYRHTVCGHIVRLA